jgi:epoxyqueuosine reductase
MEERADQRASPAGLWPEVRSLIMLGMSYAPPADPLRLAGEGGIGRISAYAQGQDYHDVVKKALKALARWLVDEAGCGLKVFVDTAPVMEKPLAQAAGLGWQGKHSNLVSREHGSWLFLGAIMTTLELEPDPPGRDRCGSCDACQSACPTNAFPAPYRVDARRCISYLTIEHKGPIPLEFREAIGNRIYGCDDCLAVCPELPAAVRGLADQADRTRSDGPQRADRGGQQRAGGSDRACCRAPRRSGARCARCRGVGVGQTGGGHRASPLLVSAAMQEARSKSSPVGRRASIQVTTGSLPAAGG